MHAPETAARPLRILEVGGDALFMRGAPEQTDFFWCGQSPPAYERLRLLTPPRLVRRLLDLRAGRYDLLVVHAPQYAPWHPRSWLSALRDWGLRAPLGLFALFAWRMLLRFHKTPIVAIDLGDSFGVGRHNFALSTVSRLFFKRELPADHWRVFYRTGHRDLPGARWRDKAASRRLMQKLRPISYGAQTPPDAWTAPYVEFEKTADIFFAGRIEPNSTVRTAGLGELEQLAKEGYVVDAPTERLPWREFLARLSSAWLVWSPEGLGWDCSRHYEAPLFGSVPLMNYPTILRHRPLADGEHCFLYPIEPGGLASAARAALADKPRLRRMARAAHAHVQRHHSWRARAEYVTVSVLGQRLDGSPSDPERSAAEGVLQPFDL